METIMSSSASHVVESGLISTTIDDIDNQKNTAKTPSTGRVFLGALFSLIYIMVGSNLLIAATYNVHKTCAMVIIIVPGCTHLSFGFIALLHKLQPTSIAIWTRYDNLFKFVKIAVALILWATDIFRNNEYNQATVAKFYSGVVGLEMILCAVIYVPRMCESA